MANGKTSAKIESALNRGIAHQAENEWRKNSPVVQKFATKVFVIEDEKKPEIQSRRISGVSFLLSKNYLFVGMAKKVERAFGVVCGRLSVLITTAPASGNLILASA